MKVIVIDDEARGREMLTSLLKKEFSTVNIVAEASSAFEARILINEHQPDLIFLDINMPMLNGFDLLQSFSAKPFYTVIVTAYNNYASEALKHGAIGYLLKPIIVDELKECFVNVEKLIQAKKKQMQVLNSNAKSIVLNTHKGTDVIPFENILYIYAQVNYVDVYLLDGSKNNYAKTLKIFNELLPKNVFFRVHKSFIINTNHITGYDKIKKQIIINQTIKIPVARDKRAEILNTLSKI